MDNLDDSRKIRGALKAITLMLIALRLRQKVKIGPLTRPGESRKV